MYISGISKTVAKNIVAYREENGRFDNRKQLFPLTHSRQLLLQPDVRDSVHHRYGQLFKAFFLSNHGPCAGALD